MNNEMKPTTGCEQAIYGANAAWWERDKARRGIDMKTNETKHTDHVVAFLNRDMMDTDTLAKSRAEHSKIIDDKAQLLAACIAARQNLVDDYSTLADSNVLFDHPVYVQLDNAIRQATGETI